MDEPLPEVLEGLLDAHALSEYLSDLEMCAEGLTMSLKSGATLNSGEHRTGNAAIEELRQHLASASPPRAQVRYRFDGDAWLDTLIPGPDGVRLVRVRAVAPD